MKKSVKKVLAAVLALVIIACCFTACGSNYTASNTEYVIGFSGPLTGENGNYGKAVQNSAQMAVDEINAAGGLNGVKFRLVAMDDMNDATKVSTNYSKLMEGDKKKGIGGMQVSLGTVTTQPGLEFTNLSVEDNVFFLTPSASGDDIPANDNGFQMCFADGNQGAVAAKYVNENFKDQTIGIFYKSDEAYSNGIYKQFMDNLDSSIKHIDTVFTAANTSDFSTQISTLKDCKFIFMPIYYTPASVFMTQAKDQMSKDTTYYGCDGFDGLANVDGFDINSIPQEITMLSHFNSKAESGAAAEFVKKYTAKYGEDTLNQFGASAYDCVYAIYNAMKSAIDKGKEIPVTISASDLCEILKSEFTGGFTYSGNTGDNITWQTNGYVTKGAVKYVLKEASK